MTSKIPKGITIGKIILALFLEELGKIFSEGESVVPIAVPLIKSPSIFYPPELIAALSPEATFTTLLAFYS